LQSRGDYAGSLEPAQEAAALAEAAGPSDESLTLLADALRVFLEAKFRQGDRPEALRLAERRVEICTRLTDAQPADTARRANLGEAVMFVAVVLDELSQRTEALPVYQRATEILERAVQSDPGNTSHLDALARTLYNRGSNLEVLRRWEEAASLYQQAIRREQEAIEAQPAVLRFRNNQAFFAQQRASLLEKTDRLEEAISTCRQVISGFEALAASNPTYVAVQANLFSLYSRLYRLLMLTGKPEEARAVYAKAEAVGQRMVVAKLYSAAGVQGWLAGIHNGLGDALGQRGNLDGAAAAYAEALRVDPKNADATRNLPWAERLRPLVPRLPGVLAGTDRPATAQEALGFADLCWRPFQKRYAASARFYEQAFAADPAVAGGKSVVFPTDNSNRYDAACVAARSAGGDGADAPTDPAERAALRAKALAWLRTDLALRQRQAASSSDAERRVAAGDMGHWLGDADLSAVRGPEPLAKLPAAEREEWEKFWADVKATLADARKPAPRPEAGADKK
jgi:tetratricopeptide (TPR) repeat protein